MISKARQGVKDLVEVQGVKLEEWNIDIKFGIKTGFNEAFYLDKDQRDYLLAADPACDEILVPLLRGRTLERYKPNWDETWMINSHNGNRRTGTPRVDVAQQYPSVYEHLKQWEEELTQRYDKGDHWSNLRNCAYLDKFFEPKIIYQDIAQSLPFYLDEQDHYFFNNTLWMIVGEPDRIHYLTAFLNSSIFRCCFRDNFPEYSGNAYRLFSIFMLKIPVKRISAEHAKPFQGLVNLIQLAKKEGCATANFLENLIDACVMECYFKEHMEERDLLLLSDLEPHLAGYDISAEETERIQFLSWFTNTFNSPQSPIRNRLLRLSADSPDLLAVIKQEGRI